VGERWGQGGQRQSGAGVGGQRQTGSRHNAVSQSTAARGASAGVGGREREVVPGPGWLLEAGWGPGVRGWVRGCWAGSGMAAGRGSSGTVWLGALTLWRVARTRVEVAGPGRRKGGRGLRWCLIMERLPGGRGGSGEVPRDWRGEHERQRFGGPSGPPLAPARRRPWH
jgi:hypothetical protein